MARYLSFLPLAICWLMVIVLGVLRPQHYSDESILSSTIDDPIFGGVWETQRHVVPAYFDDASMHTMTQRERLDHIVKLLNATIRVFERANISVFLDAGVLLGHYRHEGKMIPWDIDGDVGILSDECRSRYPSSAGLLTKLREEIEPPFMVEYIDCHVPRSEDRIAGVIFDPRTGLKVDVFAFLTVDATSDSFSWRKQGAFLQRDLDKFKYHYVIPRDAILPLRWGNFSGITGNIIANDPKRTLQWDFGFVIDEPIFFLQINRKISLSALSIVMILAALLVNAGDPVFVSSALAALMVLGGGLRVLALLAAILSRINRTPSKSESRFSVPFLFLVLVMLLLAEFQPIFPVIFSHSMEALGTRDFRVNKDRYCLLYKLVCVDS